MADRILVLATHDRGALRPGTFELLGLAHRLAAGAGRQVGSLLLGSGVGDAAAELARRGGGEVLHVDGEALADYTQDGYGRVLEEVCASERPWLVLAAHGPVGWDVMPRLGAALGIAVATEVTDVDIADGRPRFTRKTFGGKFEARLAAEGEPPFLATVQKGAHPAIEGAPAGGVRRLPCPAASADLRTRFVEVKAGRAGGVDLTAAEVIVAGGRGVGDPQKFAVVRDLAEALGGQVGASRPVTDAGWLPPEHQVGSSGVTVAPKLYIAAGISGAIQHVVGMKGSGYIVAINRDAEAPIFQVADVGVVGDLFEVLPALTRAVRAARSQSA
jgi:electron transfer flavoprotein alpha subunit